MHLARDPMGMKPVYYVSLPGGMAFASEVKAFRVLPGFRLEPGALGLEQYLEFGYVFDENQTFLEGVSKLPPGCRMEVRSGGKVQIHTFFAPSAPGPDDRRNESERIDELRDVLNEVSAEHLIADVPVCLLLSGAWIRAW